MEDDNIEDRVREQSTNIIQVLKQHVYKTNHEEKNNIISKNDFFSLENSPQCDFNDLWNFLSYENVYPDICVESVEDAFYKLFFLRKELANAIYTDRNIVGSLFNYVSLVLYPMGIIAITRIFGYQNSFGDGVDLFKTYLLGLSILMSKFSSHFQFAALMLYTRPLNIGDVILYENKTFRIHHLSFSHIHLKGPFYTVVPNEIFTSQQMINLSRTTISDSCQIVFPVITMDKDMNGEYCKRLFHEYNQLYPKDVDLTSLRCGWISSLSEQKIMECNWRYKFRIFNRSRHNNARTRIVDFLHSKCSAKIANDAMHMQLASGGFHPKDHSTCL